MFSGRVPGRQFSVLGPLTTEPPIQASDWREADVCQSHLKQRVYCILFWNLLGVLVWLKSKENQKKTPIFGSQRGLRSFGGP